MTKVAIATLTIPPGPQGEPGPPGAEGPEGRQGLPGVNAVPADQAVGTYVATPNSASNAAVRTLIQDATEDLEVDVPVYSIVEDPENPWTAVIVVGTAGPAPTPTGEPPAIVTTTLGPLTVGVPVDVTLAVTGEEPVTLFVASGSLPAGLTLSGRRVTGTPTAGGSYGFSLTATNPVDASTRTFSGNVAAAGTAPTITGPASATLTQGVPASVQLTATGQGPITWSIASGTVPPGLTLSSSGLVSGTPTGSGPFSVQIRAQNSVGSTTATFSGTITASTGPVNPGSGAPEGRVASFGPNGTHYPSRTPWVGDTAGWNSDVEVDCTWTAIGAAIDAAAAQHPNGKCRIRVRPGTLPGNGAGSTSTPVLQNRGATGRASRIVVVPRDGVFSITHTASGRLHNVAGVSFVGFSPWGLGVEEASSSGVLLTNCQDTAWAWSKTRFANITSSGGETNGVELVECVAPEQGLEPGDRMAFRNGDGGNTRNVLLDGCYFAGNYKIAGHSSHCDTLQTSGNGVFESIDFRDTAMFGSTNATYITTPATSGDLVHSAFVGGMRTALRYPVGSDRSQFISGPVTFNGAPTDYTAADSLLVGKVVPKFVSVANTKIIAADAGPAPVSGAWTVDTGLFDSAAKIDAAIPLPTDSMLQSIWAAA